MKPRKAYWYVIRHISPDKVKTFRVIGPYGRMPKMAEGDSIHTGPIVSEEWANDYKTAADAGVSILSIRRKHNAE